MDRHLKVSKYPSFLSLLFLFLISLCFFFHFHFGLFCNFLPLCYLLSLPLFIYLNVFIVDIFQVYNELSKTEAVKNPHIFVNLSCVLFYLGMYKESEEAAKKGNSTGFKVQKWLSAATQRPLILDWSLRFGNKSLHRLPVLIYISWRLKKVGLEAVVAKECYGRTCISAKLIFWVKNMQRLIAYQFPLPSGQ